MKRKITEAAVLEQTCLAQGIYSMWLRAEEIASEAGPGQFISMYCREGSRLLPRPISLCETDRKQGRIRVVYRVAGKGTKEFSEKKAGDTIRILGPLGNGFPLKEKKALLVGGGIGIPPMLQLAKELPGEKQMVMGYRNEELFLKSDLERLGPVYVSTDDGSAGTKGTVLDAIRENRLEAEVLYACGPLPMLRGLKAYAAETGMEAWISLEERMACGIGACLACVCKSTEVDDHSRVRNKRVCKEGPVFLAEEVDLS